MLGIKGIMSIKEIIKDVEELKKEVGVLTDIVLEQQKEINNLKDKDEKPKYMG